MKVKKDNKTKKKNSSVEAEEVAGGELSEEEKLIFKNGLHQSLVSSLSFAEVVQIINNMLIKEVDERFENMDTEEIRKSYEEYCEHQEKLNQESSESNQE